MRQEKEGADTGNIQHMLECMQDAQKSQRIMQGKVEEIGSALLHSEFKDEGAGLEKGIL